MDPSTTQSLAHAWQLFGDVSLTVLRILLIIVAAWIASVAVQRAIRAFRQRVAARLDSREAVMRAETLGRVSRYIATVAISLIAVMLVLGEMGISVAPILGAAGVVGLAVGFGAQSLVKDYFNGFFILLENQIQQGDVVDVGGHSGLVEELTLRYVRLRDYDGNVHYVPNSQITTVVNMSRGFAQAVMDVGVAYREDADEVMEVMREVGKSMREDPEHGRRLLDDLEIAGVDRFGSSEMIVRCRFRTVALEQWTVRREFLRRLKKAFDRRGIEIAVPHLRVYAGADKRGEAQPFRITPRRLRPHAPTAADAMPMHTATRQ